MTTLVEELPITDHSQTKTLKAKILGRLRAITDQSQTKTLKAKILGQLRAQETVLDAGGVKATIILRPNRGQQTRITVHHGDTFRGGLAAGFPVQYVKAGDEEAVIDRVVNKFGRVRVAVQVKLAGKRTYPNSVVLTAAAEERS